MPSRNPGTIRRARYLRQCDVPAEKLLWSKLRNNLLGAKFRRQHPIGPYVADFACCDMRLIVETDGDTHGTPTAMEHDQKRTAFLTAEGWRVLRFTNGEVFDELETVLDSIRVELDARTAKPPVAVNGDAEGTDLPPSPALRAPSPPAKPGGEG